MLFILSDELLATESTVKERINRAIKHIATAVFESKHLLFGSIDVLKHFKKVFRLDADLYNLFNALENNYYTTPIDFITRRIEIVINVITLKRVEENIEIFQASIDEFQESSTCQRTILLGEDLNDCFFYEHVLKWFVENQTFNVNCVFEKDNGGGVNTAKSIKNHLYNKKILLSIIDTDRKYPNSKTGETYDKCAKYINKEKGKFKLLVLNVQEIENLMPFNFLEGKAYFGEHAYKKDKFDLLRQTNPSLLKFFDIKKGIKKGITEEDPQYKEFARRCCACDPNITDFDTYYDSINNDEYVYPPFSRILNIIENDLKERINDIDLLDFQESEWHRIGKNLVNFTCARNNEALN
ncbi:hypothetical protein [uncultured Bacteroides sp.]|uniref:hypothetical protein n=1 Tax=uncultured Bacteroides sp. TaxID=162156 RepID=UPI002AA6E87C|nr:hypothetical protein [uncultured Bacteroides sp.]